MKKNLTLIVVLFWTFSLSFSQSNEDLLKMMVDKKMISQQDVDELKKESDSKTNKTLSKIKTAFTNSDIFRLTGYGQAMYRVSDNPGINNSFQINRLMLIGSGNLNPKFSYLVMYDFGPKTALHEYYGEYTPSAVASVRFGQFKVPFTLENPISPTKWEGIYGSLSVNALAGIANDVIGSKAGRDLGIQLSGKFGKKSDFFLVEYYGGLFNGTGMNTAENNNHKDFAGTLIFQPTKGLKLAGTGYSGTAPYASPGETVVRNHVRNRWSIGGEYNKGHWYARSEYLYGNDGGWHREGFYGVAMWKPQIDKLDFFGKYDFYNPDKEGKRLNKITEYTAGINYYFSTLSRVQLNYIYTDRKSEKYSTIAAQLQISF